MSPVTAFSFAPISHLPRTKFLSGSDIQELGV
jgi:hypothetical protein